MSGPYQGIRAFGSAPLNALSIAVRDDLDQSRRATLSMA